MSFFGSWFGKKVFKPQSEDAKMWQLTGRIRICQPCDCFHPDGGLKKHSLCLHAEAQDKNCAAWERLENLIEAAARKRSKEFCPGLEMPPEMWGQIVTLPASIAKLASVKRLYLYGSNLVRLPPEIGAMENLEELDIYTSYRLHWLPFEVTRCKKLSRSRASTRALYGNYKYRSPFPELGEEKLNIAYSHNSCSVCGANCTSERLHQVWISLRVGTDVFPLLVNSCSLACLQTLPKPAKGYVQNPHTSGLSLQQPRRGHTAVEM
jgi:hypothetical protein